MGKKIMEIMEIMGSASLIYELLGFASSAPTYGNA